MKHHPSDHDNNADNSETIDAGDKKMLARNYTDLFGMLPELKVVGGCCGTDHSQIAEICIEAMRISDSSDSTENVDIIQQAPTVSN